MAERTRFQYDGFTEVSDRIMRMATSDKDLTNRIRKAVDEVLIEARSRMMAAGQSAMKTDPRHSIRAVRRAVYKKIFGGQINILNARKGSATPVPYNKPRTLVPGQRGGNRIKPSRQTLDADAYFGKDRGFILRFVNSGTSERQSRYGNRGRITARNWFMTAGEQTMQQAAERLAEMIDNEIIKAFI